MKIKVILLSVVIAILITLLTIAAFVTLPWLGIYVGTQLLDNPPSPEITYGEFPFKLVYEINGETKVIEDTLICEYDGIEMDEGQGKYRKWKERLASGNKKIHILNTDGALGIVFRKEKL